MNVPPRNDRDENESIFTFSSQTWPGWPTLATYEFPVWLYFLLYGYVVQWQTAFATATTGCTFPMRAVR